MKQAPTSAAHERNSSDVGGRTPRPIPSDGKLDATLALAGDPYRYISRTCRRLNSDVFQTRLLLRPAICMTGSQAATLFYEPEKFRRQGALPKRFIKTLFGQGGVQGLEGEAHRHRKQMFLSLMAPDRIEDLVRLSDAYWHQAARGWEGAGSIVLYEEARKLLCRTVCAWAGVPLDESDVEQRTQDLAAMYEHAGAVGLNHWLARRARARSEAWLIDMIERIRNGTLQPAPEGALNVIARHRDLQGQLLEPRVAAVELLSVLRTTVAVSVFVTLAAMALHEFPQAARQCRTGGSHDVHLFAQEVRRFYPFFPAVVARVRSDFEWRDWSFSEGTLVLLDLYGTNHDARNWTAPDEFRPERFNNREESPFDFIPQGGGSHERNHRCAGEWITIALIESAVNFLGRAITYDVPQQNLNVDFSKMPALPDDRFVISNVRHAPFAETAALVEVAHDR